MQELRDIKTDDHTISSGHLDVGDGHEIYYEQWGNSRAKTPIISFHGGPGGSYRVRHKSNFDPAVHQVIFFDQRGCGNSLPYGKLEHNTTEDIMHDAEQVLDHLEIGDVYATGLSWGSALATLFTIRNPQRVKATIVGSIFLASHEEITYIDKGLFVNFFPEVWERFLKNTPKAFHGDPAAYHYEKLATGTTEEISASAHALEELEGPLLSFDWAGYPSTTLSKTPDQAEPYDYVPYQMYAHFLSNNCFLPDKYILQHAPTISTPFAIVQGRYDMVCPPATAFALHSAINHSKLYITLASHSGSDSENRTVRQALIDTLFA